MHRDKIYRPNVTLVGLSFGGTIFSLICASYFIGPFFSTIKHLPDLTEAHVANLIGYLIPISIFGIMLYHSLMLLSKLYSVRFLANDSVKIAHIFGINIYEGPITDLKYSKANDSMLNDPFTNIVVYQNLTPINFNWLKGRLIVETKSGRTITFVQFGYDNWRDLRSKITGKHNNA